MYAGVQERDSLYAVFQHGEGSFGEDISLRDREQELARNGNNKGDEGRGVLKLYIPQ